MDQHGAGGDPAAYEPLLSSLIEIKKKNYLGEDTFQKPKTAILSVGLMHYDHH